MHRRSLEQAVCTSALNSKPAKGQSTVYETTHPEFVTPELSKVAARSKRVDHNGKPYYARYSVAVWRVKDAGAEARYFVGIGLYDTALGEFVDCHFTDDVHYCRMWKQFIAPACRHN